MRRYSALFACKVGYSYCFWALRYQKPILVNAVHQFKQTSLEAHTLHVHLCEATPQDQSTALWDIDVLLPIGSLPVAPTSEFARHDDLLFHLSFSERFRYGAQLPPCPHTTTMSNDYYLQIIRAEDLLWNHSFRSRIPDPYVLLKLGNITRTTRVIKGSLSPIWAESFIFSLPDTSIPLVVEVKHRSILSKGDTCIGRVEMKFIDLLSKCALDPGDVALNLSLDHDGKSDIMGRIVLRVSTVGLQEGTEISLEIAQEAIRRSKYRRTEGTADVTQPINDQVSRLNEQGSELYQAVGALLAKLHAFKQVIDTLSEIHPFLAVAWRLTTVLYSAVQNVLMTDQKIINLVHSMEDAFSFVQDVEMLPAKVARVQNAVTDLLKQTAECCLFVSRYVTRCFLRRLVDINSSEKIDEFERTLAMFKQQIESGAIIHTAIISMRTPGKIDDLLLRQRLNPSLSDAFDRPTCLPDTRVDIRRQISEWVVSESEQNIFWLHGVAGSGKSTISTTIAQHFRDMSRLGAFLCFERGKSEPASVIRTIAYKLALFDGSIGENILEEIEKDKDISTAASTDQFKKLLLQPLKAASTVGPILIVLDALDECGSPNARSNVMTLFRHEFRKLPKNFRFLLTSRRETDIDIAFTTQPDSTLVMELDYTSSASHQDVLSYLRSEMHSALTRQIGIPTTCPWEDSISSLSKAAGGLFIWASTAVKLVSDSDNPFRTFKNLIADSRNLANFGLRELYATVLRNSGIAWGDGESRARFHGVLSLLLFGKIKLSCKTIDGILGFPSEESSRLVLSRLRCLLSYSEGEPVHLFHASFGDYLTSLENSEEPWFVNSLDANRLILDRCFSVMENMLHFDMCNLETSFVRNADIPGLEDRVKSHIPLHLEYACMHWASHLHDLSHSSEVLDALSDFAHKRLLFWFEALSLTGTFGRVACSALLELSEWTKNSSVDLTTFLRDAAELVTIFAQPIIECTPHIYVTMLPLSKDESVVSAHYSKRMPSMVDVQRTGSKRPLKYMRVLPGHGHPISCVCVSADGRFLASGSWDGVVRICDFHSGEETMVLEGHKIYINYIYFLPTGGHIISASLDDTLRTWDIRTGEAVVRMLQGYSRDVFPLITPMHLSPDGRMFALVGRGNGREVVVWNVEDGTQLMQFEDDTNEACKIAFSDDSKLLASASDDGTVRIWNTECKDLAFGPFVPFSDNSEVHYISFSPGGKCVICTSYNELTVGSLGAEGFTVVLTLVPFSDDITSCAYSPCGRRIAIASKMGEIVVLDAGTGRVVSGPFKGHTGAVHCVCFSPDGRHVISGSEDWTVRIWDTTVNPEEKVVGYRGIIGVAISDDGALVACACGDPDKKSIVVWDVRSGDVVAGPVDADAAWMAFSPDNSRLVSVAVKMISVWDVESGRLAFDIPTTHMGWIRRIAVSPDGASIASGDGEGKIMVWDMATRQRVFGPTDPRPARIFCLQFFPDGKRLAMGSSVGVTVWDTKTWQLISETSTGNTISIRFSSDCTRIAAKYVDVIVTWDIKQGRIVAGPWKVGDYMTHSFARNVLHVVSKRYGYDTITISRLDAEGIREVAQLYIPDDFCYRYFRDASRIVLTHSDGTIRILDVSDLLQDSGNHGESSTNSLSEWTLRDDGWAVGGRNGQDLILWVPHDLRRTLQQPRQAVLNVTFSTKLDLTRAALGNRWTECFTSV